MCLKAVQDSCTADLAGAARAALGAHECRRRPGVQQETRLSIDRETWRLFTKTGERRSIREEPQLKLRQREPQQVT